MDTVAEGMTQWNRTRSVSVGQAGIHVWRTSGFANYCCWIDLTDLRTEDAQLAMHDMNSLQKARWTRDLMLR